MVQRIGGARRKTRGKFSKHYRSRGKISLRKYLQEFEPGDKVALSAEPAVQSGMYFRRFHGKMGIVNKKLGRCYEIIVSDFAKEKRLVVHPVHLKRIE